MTAILTSSLKVKYERSQLNVSVVAGSVLRTAGRGDVVVVIDVIRAFTTASILLARGAREVVCARDHADAVRLDPEAIIVGEIETGVALPGVIPNSPSEVGHHDFSGRRVTLFTLNGTRALYEAPTGAVLMAAAAANVGTTAQWIRTHANAGTTYIMVSDPDGPEDHACARHLADLLRGVPVNSAATSQEIRLAHEAHWTRWGSKVTSEQWRTFEADVEVCARLDTYSCPMFVTFDAAGRLTIRPHRLSKEVDQG